MKNSKISLKMHNHNYHKRMLMNMKAKQSLTSQANKLNESLVRATMSEFRSSLQENVRQSKQLEKLYLSESDVDTKYEYLKSYMQLEEKYLDILTQFYRLKLQWHVQLDEMKNSIPNNQTNNS